MSATVTPMNPVLAQTQQPQTVIVYRSKTEQMQDEAAQAFMKENPDAILYGVYALLSLVAVVFLLCIGNFIRMAIWRRKTFGRSNSWRR